MNGKLQMKALRVWHAWLAGGFLVAFLTGDEDTYAMHQFAGYAVLAAVVVRLVAGMVAPSGSPWRLPRPGLAALSRWWRDGRGRNPLFAWLAAAVLMAAALAAATGALADPWPAWEHMHEGLSEAALWPVFAHVAFILYVFAGRRLLQRLAGTAVVAVMAIGLVPPAEANDARRALLDAYARQARSTDAGFTGFSAARGEALFRTRWAGGDERTPSCTACHTEDPRQPGRNAKTGRGIDPVAVSVAPKRFTDAEEVEKQFRNDCKSVLGRACTVQEKGDYITFMESR